MAVEGYIWVFADRSIPQSRLRRDSPREACGAKNAPTFTKEPQKNSEFRIGKSELNKTTRLLPCRFKSKICNCILSLFLRMSSKIYRKYEYFVNIL